MDDSARVYSVPFTLRLYDLLVLRISNSFAWRCPTSSTLLPFFTRHLTDSGAHMDVGVGTGYYTATSHRALSKLSNLTLLDLNSDSLKAAERRTRAAGFGGELKLVKHSVFDPVPDELRGRFSSISLFYLLHCLSGSFPDKVALVASSLAPCLAPGPESVLYGATILGKGVRHNWLGTKLMNIYNKKGIFGNSQDSRDELERGLSQVFEDVDVRVVGVVALFVCKRVRSTQR